MQISSKGGGGAQVPYVTDARSRANYVIHTSGHKNAHSSPFLPFLRQCKAQILVRPHFPPSLVAWLWPCEWILAKGIWAEAMCATFSLCTSPQNKKNRMWSSLASFSFPNDCRWTSQRWLSCMKYHEREKCTLIMKNHYDFGVFLFQQLSQYPNL